MVSATCLVELLSALESSTFAFAVRGVLTGPLLAAVGVLGLLVVPVFDRDGVETLEVDGFL